MYARAGVVIRRDRLEPVYERVAGYFIGPPLNAEPIVWEVKHPHSIEQALSRNLCTPADYEQELPGIIRQFNAALVREGADALGVRPCKAVSHDEAHFVEAQRGKRNKYIAYLAAFVSILLANMFDYYSAVVQRASFFVKREVLAPGKMPRAIIDVPKHEVLSLRPYDHLVEEFTMQHASVKGVPSQLRAGCIERAIEAIGPHIYAYGVDDTSRDSNVNIENKRGYVSLLGRLAVYVNSLIVAIYTRTRVAYRARGLTMSGALVNLASGASYTSSLNWYVSMLMMWYICETCGVARAERVLVAEGDDSLILVRDTPSNRARLASVDLTAIGRVLGKILKLEGEGSLTDSAIPFVGGYVAIVGGWPRFVPSYKRGWLKASVVTQFGTDGWPQRKIYALCRSKAISVIDKYDGVPIYWAYANVLARLYNIGSRAAEPDDAAREVYARAGITVDRQLYLEQAIFGGWVEPRDF